MQRREDGVDWIARAGLVAYGVVHLVLGFLSAQVALGDRKENASNTGAFRELAQQPFGGAVVTAVGIGLLLLAAWQAYEAWRGHERESGGKRTFKRATSGGKSALYAFAGVTALRLVIGSGGGSSGGSKTMTAKVLDLPAGQLIVAGVGIGIGVVGVMLARKAVGDRFLKDIQPEGARGTTGAATLWAGRIGHAAKAAAYLTIGLLVLLAGVNRQPNQSGGLDAALNRLLGQPFGPYLVMAIGVGFAAYGVFCFVWARHLDRSRAPKSSVQ